MCRYRLIMWKEVLLFLLQFILKTKFRHLWKILFLFVICTQSFGTLSWYIYSYLFDKTEADCRLYNIILWFFLIKMWHFLFLQVLLSARGEPREGPKFHRSKGPYFGKRLQIHVCQTRWQLRLVLLTFCQYIYMEYPGFVKTCRGHQNGPMAPLFIKCVQNVQNLGAISKNKGL